jgi:hypothetical protein
MDSGIGTRGYDTWLELYREDTTDDLLLYVASNIYCLSVLFSRGTEKQHWIILWNAYVGLKTNLEVLAERGIHSYTTKMAAEAIVTRLENALDTQRSKGRESRIARKLAAKK